MKKQLSLILLGLVCVSFGGLIPSFEFLGQYYDSTTGTTLHVCNGPEPLAVYIGISLANNPYFIYGFGRGSYQGGVTVSGSEMYVLENGGLSPGNFTFDAVNATRWVGSFTPSSGPLVGSKLRFNAEQVNSESPEEEYCVRPAPANNKTIYGLWEWLETKNGVYHHTQATFFTVYPSLSPSPTQINSSFFVANANIGGCYGYTDFLTNQQFRGSYTGKTIYEERGWIGYALETGNSNANAIFYMRVGNSFIEERIVGYYLLAGRDNPAGFQILSNSATIGNPVVGCPILSRGACPGSSQSGSAANSLSGVTTSFLKDLF